MTELPPSSKTGVGEESFTARWGIRLFEARWVLITAGVIILVLAILGRISLVEGASIYFLLLSVALVIPRRRPQIAFTGEEVGTPLEMRNEIVTAFADALDKPCIIVAERGLVVHANPRALAQYPKAQPGTPLSFFLRNPEVRSAIEQSRLSLSPRTAEIHQPVPTEMWIRVNVSPLRVEHAGRWWRGMSVLLFEDVTAQKRSETMRSDFIANASHELRTPLTSVMGFIDTLLGPAAKDAENRERFLNIMRTQAERMSALIDDLLSLSRIEQRQHLVPSGRVVLGGLLQEIAEGMQARAAGENLKLSVTIPDEPVEVTGERDELYEVFENLIDNAIKYGGSGKAVEVELKPATGRPAYAWQVLVTDHGPGIASEHVPRLTERFYRVDAESSRKKKGTGLGLAIVKHIVNRHRGLLTIRSALGEGTTVEVLLPKG